MFKTLGRIANSLERIGDGLNKNFKVKDFSFLIPSLQNIKLYAVDEHYHNILIWIGEYRSIPLKYMNTDIYKMQASNNDISFILDMSYSKED